jgi:hypothetical protein
VALHAVLAVEREPAMHLPGLIEIRHSDARCALLDGAAHPGVEQPIRGREMLVGCRDVVDTGIENRSGGSREQKQARENLHLSVYK